MTQVDVAFMIIVLKIRVVRAYIAPCHDGGSSSDGGTAVTVDAAVDQKWFCSAPPA